MNYELIAGQFPCNLQQYCVLETAGGNFTEQPRLTGGSDGSIFRRHSRKSRTLALVKNRKAVQYGDSWALAPQVLCAVKETLLQHPLQGEGLNSGKGEAESNIRFKFRTQHPRGKRGGLLSNCHSISSIIPYCEDTSDTRASPVRGYGAAPAHSRDAHICNLVCHQRSDLPSAAWP